MKNHHWKITILLCCFANVIFAQSSTLEKKVTIQYFEVALEDALDDISKDYDVNFSYSIDRNSVQQKVSADVENAPLSLALEDLLEETDLTYAGIGDHVILKVDKKKRYLLSKRKIKKEPIPVPTPQPKVVRREYVTMPLQIGLYRKTTYLQTPIYQLDIDPKYDPEIYFSAAEELEEEGIELFEKAPDGDRVAQVSLFGGIGTNGGNSANTTNKLSANILWGHNGGVNGTEVGGLVNSVVKDVNGVQVAGLGNAVGGDVKGTQVGGLFNVNRGTTNGAQAAGLINVGKKVNGVQAAGLMNVADRGATGIQAAGLGNYSGRDSKAGVQGAGLFNVNQGKSNIQVAGLFNTGRGRSNMQIAGLFNVTRSTANIQVSGLLNVAKKINGFQIGLINIADTAGATIGLINIVKSGYNRFEISGSEVLYFNAELKLGSRKFYNIFHAGYRPQPSGDGYYAFGYGFGTVIKTKKKKVHHNLELLATQIGGIEKNQNPSNSKNLNLMNQLRWSMDIRVGRSTSLFFGPTFNLMVSKLVDVDTKQYDLDILPYTMFEKVSGSVNTTNTNGFTTTTSDLTYMAGWVGLNAGIRF